MIDTQAALISKQRAAIRELEEKLLKNQTDIAMYRAIVREVQSHPSLQAVWDELVMQMKLLGIKF